MIFFDCLPKNRISFRIPRPISHARYLEKKLFFYFLQALNFLSFGTHDTKIFIARLSISTDFPDKDP